MKLTDFIKRLIRNYFIIFAIIVIFLTILRQIFLPDSFFTVNDIYIYMLCSLAADLSSLILYSHRKIPEKEMRIRIILNFLVLESILLVLANVMGWISGIQNTIVLAVQIALIYVVIRFVLWMSDRKSAQSINEKLKTLKNDPSDESEEK